MDDRQDCPDRQDDRTGNGKDDKRKKPGHQDERSEVRDDGKCTLQRLSRADSGSLVTVDSNDAW